MRGILGRTLAILALSAVGSVPASGQNVLTLEEKLLRDCANEAKTPYCDKLRAAIVQEKEREVFVPSALSETDEPAPILRWGMFGRLAGKTFKTDDGRLFTYSWTVPNVTLQLEAIEKKNISYVKYSSGSEGEIHFTTRKGQNKFVFDGVNWLLYDGEKYRQRHVLLPQEYIIFAEKLKKGKWEPYFAERRKLVEATQANILRNELLAKRERRNSDSGFMGALTGAIMGAATGYADSEGSTVGAIAGAAGGAAVGSAGGNEALYDQMKDSEARATANAQASERELQRTIARAQNQGSSNTPSYGQTADVSTSTPTQTTSSASSTSAQPSNRWTIQGWCLASSPISREKRMVQMGSRSIEREYTSMTMYKSPVFQMEIGSFDEYYERVEPQWEAYLRSNGMGYETAGCETSRGQYDGYEVGKVGAGGETEREVVLTNFRPN